MKILENPGFCYSSGNYRKSVTSIAKKRISQQQKTRSDAVGRSFEMNSRLMLGRLHRSIMPLKMVYKTRNYLVLD